MRWLGHLIRQYLAATYAPLAFDEAMSASEVFVAAAPGASSARKFQK